MDILYLQCNYRFSTKQYKIRPFSKRQNNNNTEQQRNTSRGSDAN